MRRLGQSIVEQRTMLVAVRRVVRRAVLAALLAGAPLPVAMAQADEAGATVTVSKLEALLAWAPQHPAVKAAQAGLAAAEAQLRAARSPVRLEVSSSLTQLDVDEIDLAPEIPGMQALDKTLLSVTAGVSLRPFAFGDIADLVDQREVAVAQARLDLSESLVAIQVRTLEAAYELELASAGVTVAEQGLELAKEALAATELRVERGAATERELGSGASFDA
ncbi:MAG TPA: TolC family protein [Trueperaceae bacterium]|nr:TolC family protein [Trueperaceae bacterium]